MIGGAAGGQDVKIRRTILSGKIQKKRNFLADGGSREALFKMWKKNGKCSWGAGGDDQTHDSAEKFRKKNKIFWQMGEAPF